MCKEKNHFAMCCTKRQIDDVHEESDDVSVLDVKIRNDNRKEGWTVKVQVAGEMVVLKVSRPICCLTQSTEGARGT